MPTFRFLVCMLAGIVFPPNPSASFNTGLWLRPSHLTICLSELVRQISVKGISFAVIIVTHTTDWLLYLDNKAVSNSILSIIVGKKFFFTRQNWPIPSTSPEHDLVIISKSGAPAADQSEAIHHSSRVVTVAITRHLAARFHHGRLDACIAAVPTLPAASKPSMPVSGQPGCSRAVTCLQGRLKADHRSTTNHFQLRLANLTPRRPTAPQHRPTCCR